MALKLAKEPIRVKGAGHLFTDLKVNLILVVDGQALMMKFVVQ